MAWRQNFGSFPMTDVAGKINKCQLSLQHRSKQNFGNIRRQQAEKKRQLKQAERVAAQETNFVQVQQLKHDINGLLVAEEKIWHQRSQSHWIKSGDKNTSYFHSQAFHRFRYNNIHGLRNSSGEMCCGDKKVVSLLIEYYMDLFTIAKSCEIDSILQQVQ